MMALVLQSTKGVQKRSTFQYASPRTIVTCESEEEEEGYRTDRAGEKEVSGLLLLDREEQVKLERKLLRRKYYSDHRQALNEQQRLYRMEHRELLNQQRLLYQLENQEDIQDQRKEYYLENKEALKQQMRRYYMDNKDSINRQSKQYYLENRRSIELHNKVYRLRNREVIKAQQQQYYSENKEALAEVQRKYYIENKESIKALRRQYRQEKRKAIEDRERQRRLENKESINEWQRQHRLENKEILSEVFKKYYQENKDTILERTRQYYRENRAAVRLRHRKYYLLTSAPRKSKRWSTPEDLKGFFESVRGQLHVVDPDDWYRISKKQIDEVGGLGLFNSFGSLGQALTYAYPEFDWDFSKFSARGKKSGQRWLCVVLERILPQKTVIYEDFLHPDLIWDETSKTKMELDIWVPQFQLALEYQGEHHYYELHRAYGPSGTLALYTERDLKKKNSCARLGITLAQIPYWWDGSQNSLASSLHQLRPDIFQKIDTPPIPINPPNSIHQERKKDTKIASFMMHGRDWDGKQDLAGWYMSEKLDGVRAFWDGLNLFSKRGKMLLVPFELTEVLPRNVALDGELWVGYGTDKKLQSILMNSTKSSQDPGFWKEIKFCVFDAPMYPGYYHERLAFASQITTDCGPNVTIIPIEICLGLNHLQTVLNDVSMKNGEGIMVYHPESSYTPGRTINLLKVKAYSKEDVKFLQCNPNSYSFLCEQANGETCIVKCSGKEYKNAPSSGTKLLY